jgi:hypothetical protein
MAGALADVFTANERKGHHGFIGSAIAARETIMRAA